MLLATIIVLLLTIFGLSAPEGEDVCFRPKTSSYCDLSVMRYFFQWHYDPNKTQCRPWGWQECLLNEKDDCEKTCRPEKGPQSCNNPEEESYCALGNLLSEPRWFYDSEAKLCQPGVWHGCLFNSEDDCKNNCVPRSLGKSELPPNHTVKKIGSHGKSELLLNHKEEQIRSHDKGAESCLRPKTASFCKPGIMRNLSQWNYDSNKKECRPWGWQECLFHSKDDCEKKCQPVKGPQSCNNPKEESYCVLGDLLSEPRWFYDSEDKMCQPGVWHGCLFNSEDDCKKNCLPRESFWPPPVSNKWHGFVWDDDEIWRFQYFTRFGPQFPPYKHQY